MEYIACTSEYNNWYASVTRYMIIIELRHKISTVVCATSKGSDQHAHTRSLIRTLASRLNIICELNNWMDTILGFLT